MNKSQHINLIISAFLILIIGLTTGYSMGYFKAKQSQFPKFKWINDINPNISTVKLLKIEGNHLKGEIVGQETRIAYHPDKILTLLPGETFDIPLSQVQLDSYYQSNKIPENALFVASKKGKYYYSVFDSSAYRIKNENRVYFSEESEAEKRGYLKRE